MKTLNVAIIGTKFMGKAHSNAWLNAPHFFEMEIKPQPAGDRSLAGARSLDHTDGGQFDVDRKDNFAFSTHLVDD